MTKRMLFGTLMMVWLLVALFSCNHSQTKKEYFPNGKVKEITHWIGNTQVGDYEIYHENGVLANKGRLNRKSCCVGTCYSYYDDGSIMSIEKHDRRGKLITFGDQMENNPFLMEQAWPQIITLMGEYKALCHAKIAILKAVVSIGIQMESKVENFFTRTENQ